MAYSFNTSTVGFNGDQTPLLDISVSGSGAELDITGAADNAHTFESGLDDISVTFTVLGFTGLSVGDNYAVTMGGTWDGTLGEIDGIVTSIEQSGSLDDTITEAITIRQSAAIT